MTEQASFAVSCVVKYEEDMADCFAVQLGQRDVRLAATTRAHPRCSMRCTFRTQQRVGTSRR